MVMKCNCFNHSTTQKRVTIIAPVWLIVRQSLSGQCVDTNLPDPSGGYNIGIVASEQKFKEVVLSEIQYVYKEMSRTLSFCYKVCTLTCVNV